jgi:hypothetical protein
MLEELKKQLLALNDEQKLILTKGKDIPENDPDCWMVDNVYITLVERLCTPTKLVCKIHSGNTTMASKVLACARAWKSSDRIKESVALNQPTFAECVIHNIPTLDENGEYDNLHCTLHMYDIYHEYFHDVHIDTYLIGLLHMNLEQFFKDHFNGLLITFPSKFDLVEILKH